MGEGMIVRKGGSTEIIPVDGSTVTPVDNYSIWLQCAGMVDSYGSLANVIASISARCILTNNINALRYMVRSASTIMPAVLANSGWLSALDGSAYAITIPTMTSNTAPSGEAFISSGYATPDTYKCFDKNESSEGGATFWNGTYPWYIGYVYPKAVIPYKSKFILHDDGNQIASTGYIAGGTNKANFANLTPRITIPSAASTVQTVINTFANGVAYNTVALRANASFNKYSSAIGMIREINFYCLDLS